jgi:sugar phosphate isomerase/epimerase
MKRERTGALSRREFLDRSLCRAAGLAGLALAGGAGGEAVEPLQRKGAPRLRSSLAAYSFRDFFDKKDGGQRLTMLDFVDYCADHGCDGTEVTSYYFPKEITQDYLISLKRRAFLRGVAISGTAVGNNFARAAGPERDAEIAAVKKWVDYASVIGAPHIRVFAGEPKGVAVSEAKRLCLQAFEECAEYAGGKGVFLGLENHGGIVTVVSELLDIVRAVRSPWFGVNLDTGNFFTEEDAYEDMARLAPYAVNVQLKVEISRRGRGKGKEPTDLARVVRILREANYQGYVALEYESLDPWKEVPIWLDRMREAFAATAGARPAGA